MLSLHGSRSSPERQALLSRMEALTRLGAVAASPQGDMPIGSGFEWDLEKDSQFLVKAWAEANGHPTEPESEEITRSLTRLDFGAQDEPGAVTLWVSEGAGHTWPGSRLPLVLRLFLGRTSNEIDATAEVWRAAEAVVKPECAP